MVPNLMNSGIARFVAVEKSSLAACPSRRCNVSARAQCNSCFEAQGAQCPGLLHHLHEVFWTGACATGFARPCFVGPAWVTLLCGVGNHGIGANAMRLSPSRVIHHLVQIRALFHIASKFCDPEAFQQGWSTKTVQGPALHDDLCRAFSNGFWIAGQAVFTAARDIEPGEQVCISYINADLPVDIRQQQLQFAYGFHCSCAKCKEDLATL